MGHDALGMAIPNATPNLRYVSDKEILPGRTTCHRWLALLAALVVVAAGLASRTVAEGSESSLAILAAGAGAPPELSLAMSAISPSSASGLADWLDGTLPAAHHPTIAAVSPTSQSETLDNAAGTTVPPATAAAAPLPPSAPAKTPVPQPVRTAVPQPVRTAVPTAPQATPAPVQVASCPATWFCYPRLGIAGPIVPYTDCSGSTDVGTGIRSYSCLTDQYLMGHAYTQFGLVRQWAVGDTVFAWGKRFTVSGAVTQQSCGAPSFPLAPLSMQTSLTSSACGAVLVVQAR
jgi:hypothetical protein